MLDSPQEVVSMNKTALITGASRGIGAATAKRLAADGWELVINYNHSGREAQELVSAFGGIAVQADVSDEAQVCAMFDRIGPVGLLVSCAGISEYGLLTDLPPEKWRRLFAVNTEGLYSCCRAAIPGMVHEKAGCIITVSSVWGLYGASCEAAYAASKAAVIGLSKSLAKELGPSGIRVNCVAPGVIETDMLRRFTADEKADLAEQTPLGRLGKPEEVAELIAFLASDKAGFITGQVIGCDGGFGV
jgi:3-oxoacyl-[acyl-carrier protein] reductase